MGIRKIPVQITNEYVKGAGVAVGAAGSHNDVVLEIEFSDFWEGLTKKITWLDATGGNPTITVLTADMLKTGATNVYLVPIPFEPKAYAGDMSMTIRGVTVSGERVTRATLSAVCTFRVLDSAYDAADEGGDVNATQAEQIQAQIDTILGTISDATGAAAEAVTAKAAAVAAQAAAEAAQGLAENAQSAAENARAGVESAQALAEAAQKGAESARAAAVSAQEGAEAASESASTKAAAAASSASAASSNAATAAASAEEAAGHAGAAAAAKNDAQTASESAITAAGTATTKAEEAAASKDSAFASAEIAIAKAAEAAEAAEAAASGGVSSFNGRSGTVAPQSGDYTADMVGLGNVPNVSTDNQTPTFTQALGRANVASGDTLTVLFGKIKKYFADLGTMAFKSSVAKLDLASDVQASLGKADSALQSFTESDPTVPEWAKAASKPSYTASEVGAAANVHTHSANGITGGTLSGQVHANQEAAAALGAAQVRDIHAGTADLEAGVSPLATGAIYLVYEE